MINFRTRCNEILEDVNYSEDVLEVSISDASLPVPASNTSSEKQSLVVAIQSIEEAANAIKNQTYSDNLSTDECFCKALVALIKEIPEHKKDEARKKLFMLVMDLKEEYRE